MFGFVYRAITGRSPKWPKLRARWLLLNPKCVCCGRDAETVHHKIPFHFRPEWELDEENLASVCDKCHLTIAHCGDWSLWQDNFDEIAALAIAGIRGRDEK